MTSGLVVAGREGLWGAAGRVLVALILAGGLALGLSRAMRARSQAAGANSRTCWARIDGHSKDFETVQAAVDAAGDGDVVKIAGYCAGVERRAGLTQTVYISRSITLRGGYTTTWEAPDREANPTTLDAQAQGRVLYIVGNTSVTVEGLSITGGDAAGLGGRFGDNVGGGIYAVNARATLSGMEVHSNTAELGGGLYVRNTEIVLTGMDVAGNVASLDGGGLYLDGGSLLTAADSSFLANQTRQRDGGGMYLNGSDASLSRCIIEENEAGDDGGGFYLYETQSTRIGASEIKGNAAHHKGGGLHARRAEATLVNTFLVDNRAPNRGSAVSIDDSPLCLIHTTIARNVGGAGISVAGMGTPALTNTMLVSHGVGIEVAAGALVHTEGVLWGDGAWANGEDWRGDGTVATATVNVWGSPAFEDPDSGDYGIGPSSAAVDRGVSTGVLRDYEGDHRPMGAAPDIGADEAWERVHMPIILRRGVGGEAEG